MKNTIITARRKKREFLTFFFCFLIAFGVNVYAIVRFDTPWSELFSSLGYVTIFALGLYVGWSVVRLIVALIRKLFFPPKQKRYFN